MSAPQCAGTTTNGARCPNAPMSNSRFCKLHQHQATDTARHVPGRAPGQARGARCIGARADGEPGAGRV
ncbi:hypothetical protein NpNSSI1_00004999 [Neofusicoccum parvum]|nr:hypothetical protein NpNSSI1_00004999 [Neofusicoccum parvum]